MEGNGFRDRTRHYEELGDVVVLGASFDSPEANRAFREKYDYPFSLLSDTERELALPLGAVPNAEKGHPSRVTVVIGPDGKLEKRYENVNPMDHADEVLRDLGGTPPEVKSGIFHKVLKKLFDKFG